MSSSSWEIILCFRRGDHQSSFDGVIGVVDVVVDGAVGMIGVLS